MYSLYRAWLMRDAVTAASWATPPDLIITVGNLGPDLRDETIGYGYQFVAHKQLVSMHSGYLKSLIQNETNAFGMSITNISLPNISSESFAPLLSFMYTGYLDLTNENIYSVLLATHLLHMPRALDLCRAYLVRNQTDIHQPPEGHSNIFQPPNNTNLIKPIPSRKVHNFPQSIWSPVNLPPIMLYTRPEGPFQCISPTEKRDLSPEVTAKPVEEAKSPLAIPSTSKTNKKTSDSSSDSPSFFTCDERTVDVLKSPQRKVHKRKENVVKPSKKINNENLKVEFDVACCDGPVRFHRVLNESYGVNLEEVDDSNASKMDEDLDKIAEKEYLENYPKTQFLKLKSSNFSNFMHQQMINSNLFKKPRTKGVIQLRKVVNKEIPNREKSLSEENNDEPEKYDNSERAFTCVYCKHTFKSRYCYQKHARRHINSVREGGDVANDKSTTVPRQVPSKPDGSKEGGNVRREVRLLDMNVQYYPCKTCGSKFPSYYFVHKHRKICHANEENFDENSSTTMENSDSSSSEKTPTQETAG
ncbi:hypothetical protein RUM44_012421 [Polyplax serrata]|uniref:BTB domain-containing protein n=1 Tax=Polyplax serrata TaxID=468196 RepID=A0ABR1BF32_POLSC